MTSSSQLIPSQNQSILAAALQTAFNLRVMPRVVQSLLLDLTEAVDARIKSAFDVSRIAKEIAGRGAFSWLHDFILPALLKYLMFRATISIRQLDVPISGSYGTHQYHRAPVDECAVEQAGTTNRRNGWMLHKSRSDCFRPVTVPITSDFECIFVFPLFLIHALTQICRFTILREFSDSKKTQPLSRHF